MKNFINKVGYAALAMLFTLFSFNSYGQGCCSDPSICGGSGLPPCSDERVKVDVQDLDKTKALRFIEALEPVSYHFDKEKLAEFAGDKTPIAENDKISKNKQSGFLAQDVESIAKELDYDFDGVLKPNRDLKIYALEYDKFVVPLVSVVQQQQDQIEQLQVEIMKLKNQYKLLSSASGASSASSASSGK